MSRIVKIGMIDTSPSAIRLVPPEDSAVEAHCLARQVATSSLLSFLSWKLRPR